MAAAERPDYVKCIQHTHEEKKRFTWCDRLAVGSASFFVSIDHAAYNALAEGRLLICPECADAVLRVLRDGAA